MKKYINLSKFIISALAVISVFAACSDDDEVIYYSKYNADTANMKAAGEAIDLGLPSNTKWADRNVGAATETDNGLLFVWGDVTGTQIQAPTSYSVNPATASMLFEKFKGEEKIGYRYDTLKVYTLDIDPILNSDQLNDYVDSVMVSLKNEYGEARLDVAKVTNGAHQTLVVNKIDSTAVKYFTIKEGDFSIDKGAEIKDTPVDNLIAESKFDPATANWGNNWCMPTKAQIEELINKCKWEYTENGYKVTGPNGNSIFLPSAGYRHGDKLIGKGVAGYYASGAIMGSYHYPSMLEQEKGSVGSITKADDMPVVLVFQHGQFENTVNSFTNLTSVFALSVRPVVK